MAGWAAASSRNSGAVHGVRWPRPDVRRRGHPQPDGGGMTALSHFDEAGRAHMVDVSAKAETVREATARGRISMTPETLALVERGAMEKGDVLAVAQVGGVMASKQTGS